jgi:long-chain acyl-CoA synthetase
VPTVVLADDGRYLTSTRGTPEGVILEQRIWLGSYPPGIPAEIDPDAFPSLVHLFESRIARFAGRPAYTSFGKTLCFSDIDRDSRAFAAWLQQAAGLRPGERIALMMPNLLQYPIALFGALRAGLCVVNTNPLYTARELHDQLVDSEATAIVAFENAAAVVAEAIIGTHVRNVILTRVGDLIGFPKGPLINGVLRYVKKQVPPYRLAQAHWFKEVLGSGQRLALEPVAVGADDLAFLQYTGGTTGVSKGAMLTHRNMVANTLQADAWLSMFVPDKHQAQTVLGALPLYHIFALTSIALLWTYQGGHTILITNPRDMPTFVKTLQRHPCSIYYGVNTLFNGLLHTPGFERVDFSPVHSCVAGGMALQQVVAERWKAVTGCILSQGWGLTETAPIATTMPSGVDFNNSIGLPVPSTEVSIRNDAGEALAIGESGEICVKGPQVMRGYWRKPAETANVFFADGWLRTGDIGRMDAKGYVYIEDRKKDMILVSGFNVYPNEVEGVLASHPGVLEVAAVAAPDAHSGEAVAVFVVRKDPALTAEALIAYAHESLTGYKVPKHVYFRTELPKTNVGKILRRALREELSRAPLDKL